MRYALWANCLLMTGKIHGAVWRLREASKLYGKALVELRKSPRATQRDASIVTVKLLSMFEVCYHYTYDGRTRIVH